MTRASRPARAPGAQRVGIDLGGTGIKAGAIAPDGTIERERTLVPDFSRGPGAVLAQIAALYGELGGAGALGIGVPGLLDRRAGRLVESPNLEGFVDVDVRGDLARLTGLAPGEVHVENDANAAALGELWLGAARGETNALVLTLGTGIGGGLILGGELFAGEGMAGEVGHLVIDPAGPPCGCGSRGCLETFASATAARRRALAARLPPQAPGDLELLADRAREGSAAEAQLLREVGRDLGRGLGAVVGLLDLELFVFGGGFAAALDTLEAGIREGIAERSYGGRESQVRLVRAALGPRAGWIGAAWLALGGRALSSRAP